MESDPNSEVKKVILLHKSTGEKTTVLVSELFC